MRVDVSSEGRGGGSYPESEVTDGDRQRKLKGAWSRQKPARIQTIRLPTDESNYPQHLHRHPLRYGIVGRKGVVLHLAVGIFGFGLDGWYE